MKNSQVLSKIQITKSICPKCLKKIDAKYILSNNKVYFNKNCPTHGKSNLLISNKPKDFLEYLKYYKTVNNNKSDDNKELCLFPSYKCNLNCPICITKSNPNINFRLTPKEMEPVIKKFQNTSINIMGGEPTVYPYLEELVKIIIKNKSVPILFTNGLLLSKLNYVKWLKKIGIKEVNIQFDCATKTNLRIRGSNKNLLNEKVKAISHLNNLNMKTHLEVTLEEGINTEELNNLIQLAVKYDHICSINMRPYFKLGNLKNRNSMTLDNIISLADKSTKGLISLKNISLLQKFLMIYPFNRPNFNFCPKHRYYLLVKNRNKYVNILNFIKLKNNERKIEKYRKILIKSSKYKKINFLISLFPSIISIKLIKLMINLFLDELLRKIGYSSSINPRNRLLFIDFNGRCDLETIDLNDFCPSSVLDVCGGYSKKFNISNLNREKQFKKNEK
jgi:uncharacterized radical SAM superfamily Fe-S cluster-containing enzyme